MQDVHQIVSNSREKFSKAIEHLENELLKIRAGKASPQMLNGIMVEAYGSLSPLSAVCNISVQDSRMLVLQPWDKSQFQIIEKAILLANLGFNPQNDGQVIRIAIPPLTEERRRDLVKQAKSEVEKSKVSVRNIRRDVNEDLKKLKKDGVAEDLIKSGEDQVQKITDEHIAKCDKMMEAKEKEIMSV
jgi:ribosome recycling factor